MNLHVSDISFSSSVTNYGIVHYFVSVIHWQARHHLKLVREEHYAVWAVRCHPCDDLSKPAQNIIRKSMCLFSVYGTSAVKPFLEVYFFIVRRLLMPWMGLMGRLKV